jgi:nucleotide-binding universal stress UspA family protein
MLGAVTSATQFGRRSRYNVKHMSKVFAGVDGSETSEHAFNVAASFYKPGWRVTVVHVEDPTKDYLPFAMRATYIEEHFKTLATPRFPTSNYQVLLIHKSVSQSSREALMEYVNSEATAADLLVSKPKEFSVDANMICFPNMTALL